MDKQKEDQAEMRKKLYRDACELENYIGIEFTVGNSMDTKKKEIKELTRQCKEEDRKIIDLEKQIAIEEKKAEERANDPTLLQNEETPYNIDLIVQLEEELKALYLEKSKLERRKK